MIRKTRLVKVIFGSCAAIFFILQFLDTRTTSEAAAGSNLKQPATTKVELVTVVSAAVASGEAITHPPQGIALVRSFSYMAGRLP